jgi:hypothetical protein
MLSSFHIRLIYIALAVQVQLAVTKLASPVAYFFISPQNLSIPPFLSTIYRTLYHALSDTPLHNALARILCVLPALASNVLH